MCVLGVEGSEKMFPSEDNFWNSPKGFGEGPKDFLCLAVNMRSHTDFSKSPTP